MARSPAINNHDLSTLSESDLLDMRLCDLPLTIEGSWLVLMVERLYAELGRAGICVQPHVWLGEEWFCPDGVPGFAIPFYLAHTRLIRLERKFMLECEGSTPRECMKILRHEAGHALDNAYLLHRTRIYREQFGKFSAAYPSHYHPLPSSRNFVVHLNSWYSQSHPAEDFAETFAVWLGDAHQRWRKQYAEWPALKKLEAIDVLMGRARHMPPAVRNRRTVDKLSNVRVTLREHYRRKREYYEVELATPVDAELLRIFDHPPAQGRRSHSVAASFLRKHRRYLRNLVSDQTGIHHYSVDQILQRIISRTRQMRLVLTEAEDTTLDQLHGLLARQVTDAAENGHPRIPL